jgi:hypothetical protein
VANWTPELLPTGFVLPRLEQLLWLLETHIPTQVDPRAYLLCGHQMIEVHLLCCSTGTLNLQQSARSRPPHTLVNPRLQILLFCWHQKPPLPTEAQHASLFLTARDTSLPCQRENVRFPTEDRKSTTSYSSGNTSSVPHGTQNSSVSHCISLKESHVSLVQVLESQLFHQVAICYTSGARRPSPHSA